MFPLGCVPHTFLLGRKNSTRNGVIMNVTSILFAIGFTLAFCLSLFFGWDADVPALRQAVLVFSGFCLGGMALCIIDEM